MKFSESTEWAEPLAMMLRNVAMSVNITKGIHTVVPVPLHWRRRLQRGFNQSFLLARKLRLSGVPISTDLVRIRHTQQQWDLNPAQRRKNVKGAFAVRKGHHFEGKRIALVDDITTSGATLNECAKTLKASGAEKVIAFVVATAYHDS
jgi:ComF family protein